MGCISKILATPNHASTAKEELCVCSSKPSHLIDQTYDAHFWCTLTKPLALLGASQNNGY